jgi:DegV family protein with EDD domain
MSKIKFVTDSAADIPVEQQRAHDIQVLPFSIYMNDKEYRDGVDFTPQEFYQALVAAPTIPTHSQINPNTFVECYEAAWKDGYTDLIYTAINSKGSATYQNSLMAMEEFYDEHPEAKEQMTIHVIDSAIYTYLYGFAVVEGAKLAEQGATAGEVVVYISDWCRNGRVIFAPYDLKFAKKSGRVSAAAAFLGEALGLKPIMTFENGESKILTKVRGDKAIIPAILKLAAAEIDTTSPYCCICGSLTAENEKMIASAAAALGYGSTVDFFIGGVIAINAGPNLVGIAYRKKA